MGRHQAYSDQIRPDKSLEIDRCKTKKFTIEFLSMEGMRKSLTLLVTILGLVLFYSVVMLKLDVVREEASARIERLSSDAVDWESYTNPQTVHEVVQR